MDIRDLLRSIEERANAGKDPAQQDRMQHVLEAISNRSPSDQFASGAVFDLVRQYHGKFEEVVRSNNVNQLREFFVQGYLFFLSNPQALGMPPAMVRTERNDTNPKRWNADLFCFDNGDAAALCFMPIVNETYSARIVGIITGSRDDAYYYSMLNKDPNSSSDVIRNMARPVVFPTIGSVSGLGFQLMRSFLEQIKADYYS